MCGRSSDELDAWHTVVHHRLVGEDEWEQAGQVEVCSWACLRLAFMAVEPGEQDSEGWKAEAN
jgi:hypothetical protein